MLQGNFFDKVKKIPKPSVIKEIIQEKLKIDSKPDQPISKYDSQSYLFNEDTEPIETTPQSSPPGALPPVIELDSPELMKLKVHSNDTYDGQNADKSLEVQNISHFEGFSDLASDRSLETEISADQSTKLKKTGTGAFSALARLQEDHEQDEKAGPVYRISAELDKNVRDPFSYVTQDNEEDSIVFSKKNKGKAKKKKKGKTHYFHLNKPQEIFTKQKSLSTMVTVMSI